MDLGKITNDNATITTEPSGGGNGVVMEINAARLLEESRPVANEGTRSAKVRRVDNAPINFVNLSDGAFSGAIGQRDTGEKTSGALFWQEAKELSLEALDSFEHSVKQPVLAMAQICDHTTGTTFSKNSWLSKPAPKEAEFDSWDYWAQQTGNTLGSLPWYSLLHKVIGTGFHKAVGTSAFESMTTAQLHKYAIAESMFTGFTYGALLHPSRNKDNASLSEFAMDRFLTGSTIGATFGISALTSAKITDMIGREPNSTQRIATSFFSSAASGAFDAEVQSLRNHGRLATDKEFWRGVYTYTVIGTGMTTIHEIFPSMKTHALKQRDNSYSTDEKIARSALSGLSSSVRQAVFNGQTEASIMRLPESSPLRPLESGFKVAARTDKASSGTAAESTGSTAETARASSTALGSAFKLPSLELTSPPPLTGGPSLVFDRLHQAGLRPRVVETENGGLEIRVPLTDLYKGSHPLLKRTIEAANQGYKMRWDADRGNAK